MDETKKIQQEILNIYKAFRVICEKYNLRYYAIGGTCIGAVRHKGFIPWDDDLDVAMPIEDYNRFRIIANKELPSDYQLIDYCIDENYPLKFLKVQNKNTTFIEKPDRNDYLKFKGVYIDIMPICSIPKNKIFAFILKKRLLFLDKQNSSIRYNIETKKNLKGKIHWYISKVNLIFCGKLIYMKKWDKICKKHPLSKKNDVLFVWRIPLRKPYSNVFDYNDFEDTIEVPFEDTYISIPIGYDNYLRKDFGNDYMVLPPADNRHTHNPYILDLTRSYKEYQKLFIKEGIVNGKIKDK